MSWMPCFVKKQFALDPAVWTPIVCPIDCNMFWMKNIGTGSVTLLRTNQSDATTQDTLLTGFQETLSFPWQSAGGPAGRAYRFPSGTTILYAQPDTGTGPMVVTFVQ